MRSWMFWAAEFTKTRTGSLSCVHFTYFPLRLNFKCVEFAVVFPLPEMVAIHHNNNATFVGVVT